MRACAAGGPWQRCRGASDGGERDDEGGRDRGGRQRRGVAAAPRGQTRAKVLEALKDGPKTAGDIAAATGVPRGSASTTLSKLAKSGEVVKAERGYKLPE